MKNNMIKKMIAFVLLIALCIGGLPAWKAAAADGTGELAAPVITGVKNLNSGIKITWSKVEGADYYRVYYKRVSGVYESEWTKIEDTTATECLDTQGYYDRPLYYKVRAFRNDGTMSPTSEASKPFYKIGKPVFRVGNAKSGIRLTIKEAGSGGSSGMIIYRKGPGESSFTRIAKTRGGFKKNAGTYVDTDVAYGETYSYRICEYKGSSKGIISNVKTIKNIGAAPTLKVTNTVDGNTLTANLSWTEVPGASGYQIYYSNPEYWGVRFYSKKHFETTETSYVHERRVDSEIEYKVRAYFDDGTTRTYSAFSSPKG